MSLIEFEDFYRICGDWDSESMLENSIMVHLNRSSSYSLPTRKPSHLKHLSHPAENKTLNENRETILV